MAVLGASAGGGLAAATALLARDLGGPPLCFQMLHIPELDDRLETPSMRAFVDSPLWNRPLAVKSWQAYLGDLSGSADVPAYAAPARATDLSGLPPAYISTAENDPLRDEGIIYALRLLQAGVSVELHQFPGTFHGSALVTRRRCRSGPSARRRWCCGGRWASSPDERRARRRPTVAPRRETKGTDRHHTKGTNRLWVVV